MDEMAADAAFSLEEVGTGSRATLTPHDRAFLESPPSYEELETPLSVAPPARVLPTPSARRRASSLILFSVIAGGAVLVLVLAALRLLNDATVP